MSATMIFEWDPARNDLDGYDACWHKFSEITLPAPDRAFVFAGEHENSIVAGVFDLDVVGFTAGGAKGRGSRRLEISSPALISHSVCTLPRIPCDKSPVLPLEPVKPLASNSLRSSSCTVDVMRGQNELDLNVADAVAVAAAALVKSGLIGDDFYDERSCRH